MKKYLIFLALSIAIFGTAIGENGHPDTGDYTAVENITDEQKNCILEHKCFDVVENPDKEEMEKILECYKKALKDCSSKN
ncbi:MAG: ERG2 family protein [Alphaproteobacteria bacterium]|nr:ERG2 family protein [Alphaproteobacteria bacterium]